MQVTQIKEDISISYISALCAYAGIAYEIVRTSSQYTDHGDTLTYKLKVKNYNDLRLPSTTPIILGLLVLPEDESTWLSWNTEELLLKGCMYWAEFSGAPKTDYSDTITIRIDKKNVINTESLNQILEKIAREEWP